MTTTIFNWTKKDELTINAMLIPVGEVTYLEDWDQWDLAVKLQDYENQTTIRSTRRILEDPYREIKLVDI